MNCCNDKHSETKPTKLGVQIKLQATLKHSTMVEHNGTRNVAKVAFFPKINMLVYTREVNCHRY